MWRRLAWISRITCASSTRSCARFDISSSTGAAASPTTAGARGVEPRQHRLDLLREFGRQVVEVLERALGEQQRRRELHRQRLRNAFGAACCRAARRGRDVSCDSAGCRISAAFALAEASSLLRAWAACSVRPDAALSHASLALASWSRASRSSGWRRTTSASSASAVGISAASDTRAAPPRPAVDRAAPSRRNRALRGAAGRRPWRCLR